MVPQAFIAGAKRTAFGAYGGALKSLTAAQLGGVASKAALGQLPPETKVDHVILVPFWVQILRAHILLVTSVISAAYPLLYRL
ncbi:hypothetical protein KEM48_001102 [Puccinia striiformis f. sp. tritici PST-130]|nr:hypothetical protein KEM48_001102 [Puccinia striiformis f. sp. tritici PST-130]